MFALESGDHPDALWVRQVYDVDSLLFQAGDAALSVDAVADNDLFEAKLRYQAGTVTGRARE